MNAPLAAARSAALAATDPSLASRADLAYARAAIEAYVPRDEHQAGERARMLAFCDEHDDALLRTCVPGHLTASALIVDASGERALLTHHKKLEKWLQLGGHCDGEANLAASALRECWEESGIEGLRIHPAIVDLDIHTIPARKQEPEHLHLDSRFLVFAPEGATETVSEESIALGWVAVSELAELGTDDSVRRLFDLVWGRSGSATEPGSSPHRLPQRPDSKRTDHRQVRR